MQILLTSAGTHADVDSLVTGAARFAFPVRALILELSSLLKLSAQDTMRHVKGALGKKP